VQGKSVDLERVWLWAFAGVGLVDRVVVLSKAAEVSLKSQHGLGKVLLALFVAAHSPHLRSPGADVFAALQLSLPKFLLERNISWGPLTDLAKACFELPRGRAQWPRMLLEADVGHSSLRCVAALGALLADVLVTQPDSDRGGATAIIAALRGEGPCCCGSDAAWCGVAAFASGFLWRFDPRLASTSLVELRTSIHISPLHMTNFWNLQMYARKAAQKKGFLENEAPAPEPVAAVPCVDPPVEAAAAAQAEREAGTSRDAAAAAAAAAAADAARDAARQAEAAARETAQAQALEARRAAEAEAEAVRAVEAARAAEAEARRNAEAEAAREAQAEALRAKVLGYFRNVDVTSDVRPVEVSRSLGIDVKVAQQVLRQLLEQQKLVSLKSGTYRSLARPSLRLEPQVGGPRVVLASDMERFTLGCAFEGEVYLNKPHQSGNSFHIGLRDGSGKINAKFWNAAAKKFMEHPALKRGARVHLEGFRVKRLTESDIQKCFAPPGQRYELVFDDATLRDAKVVEMQAAQRQPPISLADLARKDIGEQVDVSASVLEVRSAEQVLIRGEWLSCRTIVLGTSDGGSTKCHWVLWRHLAEKNPPPSGRRITIYGANVRRGGEPDRPRDLSSAVRIVVAG